MACAVNSAKIHRLNILGKKLPPLSNVGTYTYLHWLHFSFAVKTINEHISSPVFVVVVVMVVVVIVAVDGTVLFAGIVHDVVFDVDDTTVLSSFFRYVVAVVDTAVLLLFVDVVVAVVDATVRLLLLLLLSLLTILLCCCCSCCCCRCC